MKLLIHPGRIDGDFFPPPSKSHTLRAIMLASFATGTSVVHNYLRSNDTSYLIENMQALGACITCEGSSLKIEGMGGNIRNPNKPLYVGNSGIQFRFLSAILSTFSESFIIDGDASIQNQRPIEPLAQALLQVGIQIAMKGKHAPIEVKGPFSQSFCTVEGQDSQFVSALLLASLFVSKTMHIQVKNPGELPWIDVTLDWLNRLGISYENNNYQDYIVHGKGFIPAFTYHVPTDLSSSIYPFLASFIAKGKNRIHHMQLDIPLGDNAFYPIMRSMDIPYLYKENQITTDFRSNSQVPGKIIDLGICIDTITAFAALGSYLSSPLTIENVAIAKTKECDRIVCIAEELKKMGASIYITGNTMKIYPAKLLGANVKSHHDHRMVFALIIAALGGSGETIIEDATCIEKTYEGFVKQLQQAGASIQWIH